jgi:mannose-1-phosphate guanylyltransferase
VLAGGTVVGRGARIGAAAHVVGSVVGEGAVIAAGAVVVRSVVGDGATVGPGGSISDSVIGARSRLGARIELVAGARVWPDVDLPDGAIRFSPDA